MAAKSLNNASHLKRTRLDFFYARDKRLDNYYNLSITILSNLSIITLLEILVHWIERCRSEIKSERQVPSLCREF